MRTAVTGNSVAAPVEDDGSAATSESTPTPTLALGGGPLTAASTDDAYDTRGDERDGVRAAVDSAPALCTDGLYVSDCGADSRSGRRCC